VAETADGSGGEIEAEIGVVHDQVVVAEPVPLDEAVHCLTKSLGTLN
jgi:hypothetical protein